MALTDAGLSRGVWLGRVHLQTYPPTMACQKDGHGPKDQHSTADHQPIGLSSRQPHVVHGWPHAHPTTHAAH